MMASIELGDIVADVIHKDIKNIYLSVYPPTGAVRISAPLRMDMDSIRVFALSRLGWIKKQQKKMCEQERETAREYLDRESHYFRGKRYLLKVVEKDAVPWVELRHAELLLQIRPGATRAKKEYVLTEWYRAQLKEALVPLVAKWEKTLGMTTTRTIVQKMKTKWGSCNPNSGIIRINLELAKKPPECLEYIVVHELAHLLEATHNHRFKSIMDQNMPKWKFYRDELNRLPICHIDWIY